MWCITGASHSVECNLVRNILLLLVFASARGLARFIFKQQMKFIEHVGAITYSCDAQYLPKLPGYLNCSLVGNDVPKLCEMTAASSSSPLLKATILRETYTRPPAILNAFTCGI